MKKYRKLPVVIEAAQFSGSLRSWKEIQNWIAGENRYGGSDVKSSTDPTTREELFMGGIWVDSSVIEIKTLEGTMTANIGDFIIKGVNGEFYPCKPDIFLKTYEEA